MLWHLQVNWSLNSCRLKPWSDVTLSNLQYMEETFILLTLVLGKEQNKLQWYFISHASPMQCDVSPGTLLVFRFQKTKQDGWWVLGGPVLWIILIWSGTSSSQAKPKASAARLCWLALFRSPVLSLQYTLRLRVALCQPSWLLQWYIGCPDRVGWPGPRKSAKGKHVSDSRLYYPYHVHSRAVLLSWK